MPEAVYIHIPFCRSICHYCDFCKFILNKEWVKPYLDALKNEINECYMGEEIKTIYIGGGTPSSLDKEDLKYLMGIIKVFNKNHLTEFTFECNWEDIDEELIDILIKNGVNRVSIGVESFDVNNLKLMNRHANYEEIKNKMTLLRVKGINNINLDLMYALPNESLKTVKQDLKQFIKLNPEHISTYSLILEDNTFFEVKKLHPLDEDLDYEMYKYICKKLVKNGYEHYEISNFAKKGYNSAHNLTYWKNKEYYGFGCGASGYYEGVRYDNTRSITKYIHGDKKRVTNLLSKDDIMDYHLILGFRLLKGINVKEFNELYNVDMFERYPLKGLIKYEDLVYENDYIFINPKKIYMMNEILLKCV